MARVRVTIDDLERGDLPALSAKSGVACATPVVIVLRPEQRPWSPLGPKVAAILPMERGRVRARGILTRASWGLLVVFGASLAASISGAGSAVLLLAAIAAIGYVVLMFVGDLSWVGSKPSEHDGEIVLTRVHPAFARAVSEQYGR